MQEPNRNEIPVGDVQRLFCNYLRAVASGSILNSNFPVPSGTDLSPEVASAAMGRSWRDAVAGRGETNGRFLRRAQK